MLHTDRQWRGQNGLYSEVALAKNLIKIIIVTRWYWTSSIPVLSTSEGHKVGQAVSPKLLGEKGLFIQLDHHTTFPVHDKGPLLSLHVIQYRNDNMVWQINTHCPICPPPPPPLCLPLPVWPPTTPGFKGGSSSSGMGWGKQRLGQKPKFAVSLFSS